MSTSPAPRPRTHRTRPRPIVGPVAILLAALVLLAAGCSSPSSADTGDGITLRIGATSVTGTPAGNLGWGDKEGILLERLAPAGVTEIEYSFFQSGKDVVAALLSGAVDVAAAGDNPALTARGNGADLALLALDSVNEDTWLIGAKDGPTSIDGLAGKAITAPQGTIRDRSAHQLIEANGLTGQIEVQDVPTPESIAGLSSGSIDATVVGGTGAVELQQRGFPVLDKTSNHDLGGVGTNIALTPFLDEHPDFLPAWQDAITATNADIIERIDEYNTWVAETDGVEVDLVTLATRADNFNTEPFPADGLEQLQAAHDFLVSEDAVDEDFDVTEWVEQP